MVKPYYDRGYWILPVKRGTKCPDLPNWKLYQTKRPTWDEITQWWKSNPNYNIGFVTGKASKLCVLDIDIKDRNLLTTYLHLYPTGMVVETSKGYHLYYLYPSNCDRLPNSFPEDNIDFRGDGGFIIGPCSTHSSGHIYNRMKSVKEGFTGVREIAPDELIRRILGKKASDSESPSTGEKWINELLTNGSKIGSRNLDGTRLVGYFLNKKLPIDIIKNILSNWLYKTDRSDGLFNQTDLDRIIISINNTHKRKYLTEKGISLPLQELTGNPTDLITPYNYFISGSIETKWLIQDWLPEATTAMMVSPPGNYKTWLAMAMAMAVSTGTKFINQFETNGRKPVLIIQQEDGKNLLRQRLRTIQTQHYIDIGSWVEVEETETGNVIITMHYPLFPEIDIYTASRVVRFDDNEIMNELGLLIEAKRYGLVIIDPLYMAAKMDNYMSNAVQDMARLKLWRDAYGTAFLLLHHTRKTTNNDGVDRLDAWGSQFLNAWIETGIQTRLLKGDDKSIILKRHFKETGAMDTDILTFDIKTSDDDEGEIRFKVDMNKDQRGSIGMSTGRPHNILKLLQDQGPMTNRQLVEETGMSKSTISKKTTDLIRESLIIKNKRNEFIIV